MSKVSSWLTQDILGRLCAYSSILIQQNPNPHPTQQNPSEMLHKHSPSYSNLRVFGCLALAHNPNSNNDKFNPRGVPCVFIGYPITQKGYMLLNLLTNEVFVTRDVKWSEHIIPYTLPLEHLQNLIPPSHEHHIQHPSSWEDSSDNETDDPPSPASPINPQNSSPPSYTSISSLDSSEQPTVLPSPPPLRKSSRPTQPPSWLKDYVTPISNLTLTTVNPTFTCFFIHPSISI